MKTQMTKDVGFDEFYESGGAVEPEEAARSLLEFAATITKEHNGQFWAPRGPGELFAHILRTGSDVFSELTREVAAAVTARRRRWPG